MDAAALLKALSTSPYERKSFDLEIKDIDELGRFKGRAAVYGNVDLGSDLIERGAFTKTVKERPVVPILDAHDAKSVLGVGTLSEGADALDIEGKFTMRVQRAAEMHALMMDEAVKGLSIGYKALQKDFKGRVRHLKEIAVREVSTVVFPMNELALVDSVKSADLIGSLSDLLRRLQADDPDAVKALLAELEPTGGSLDDGKGAASRESEPDLLHSLQLLTQSIKEIR